MSEALSGKVSIITGASSGLGLATATMFAQRGAMVTLCGRDQERLQAAYDQCTQASGGHTDRFITVSGDLNEANVREDTVVKTVQKFGRLDILVANAGMNMPMPISTCTEEAYDTIFNTNVKAIFFLIQQALPHLEKSKGNIVSTSSCLSTMLLPQLPVYQMSKAAVDHMTRCLALDLGPAGIRVNAVNPSFMNTRIARNFGPNSAEIVQHILASETSKQPMGACGTLQEIAQAICFLASDEAKFITGECLLADGGRSLTG